MTTDIVARYSTRARAGVVFENDKLGDAIRFEQGLPHPDLIPVAEIARSFAATFERAGAAACVYFSDAGGAREMQFGYLPLRERLAGLLATASGKSLDASNVLLTNGSSDALALAVRAFVDPGDGVLVETPTFARFPPYASAAGAVIRSVPMRDDGLDLDALEVALAALRSSGTTPKLLYTIPTFNIPTGRVTSLEHRSRLLGIAQDWDLVVLEDNCYHELFYEQPPPPSLLSLDETGRVVQSDSASKCLAPGIRIGWVAGAAEALEALARVRQDLGVGQIVSRALDHYIESGAWARQLPLIRAAYRRKRDVAAAALEAHCADGVRFEVPPGGLYFWLEYAEQVDPIAAERLIADAGVAVRHEPGTLERPGFRISPMQESDDRIARGVQAIGDALARAASR